MADLLVALVQLLCAALIGWGALLCLSHRALTSAELHMFDEAGPTQSRRDEDAPEPLRLYPPLAAP